MTTTVVKPRQGVAAPRHRTRPDYPKKADRDLVRALRTTRAAVPAVELSPSEFAAARSGLEVDPTLLRMIDRLVDVVRLYADHDDGGVRARAVAKQWILFRNYRGKVARGEYPPPSQRGPAVRE